MEEAGRRAVGVARDAGQEPVGGGRKVRRRGVTRDQSYPPVRRRTINSSAMKRL